MTLNVYGTSDVTCSNCVPNMSEIEQSAAELLWLTQFVPGVFHRFLHFFSDRTKPNLGSSFIVAQCRYFTFYIPRSFSK